MLISVHIPKTAGGSFARLLRQAYGRAVLFDFGDPYTFVDGEPPQPATRLWRRFNRFKGMVRRRQWSARLRSEHVCIHGHFRATKYRSQFPDARLLVWLRDPAERVASHYHYWLRRPDFGHSSCLRLHRENLSLIQFAALPSMRDLQSRYLDGIALDDFWFVGVQERFTAMSAALLQQLDLPVLSTPRRHANPARAEGEAYALAPELRARLYDLNAIDQSLYQQALRRADAGCPSA